MQLNIKIHTRQYNRRSKTRQHRLPPHMNTIDRYVLCTVLRHRSQRHCELLDILAISLFCTARGVYINHRRQTHEPLQQSGGSLNIFTSIRPSTPPHTFTHLVPLIWKYIIILICTPLFHTVQFDPPRCRSLQTRRTIHHLIPIQPTLS